MNLERPPEVTLREMIERAAILIDHVRTYGLNTIADKMDREKIKEADMLLKLALKAAGTNLNSEGRSKW